MSVLCNEWLQPVADLEKNGVGVGTRVMIEIYSTLTLGYIQNVGILRSEISNVIIKHKKNFYISGYLL